MLPREMGTIAAWLLLFGAVVSAAFTANVFRPIRRSQWLVVPSSLLSMLAAELAVYHLLWQAAGAAGLVALGALTATAGQIGLGIAAASWIGLLVLLLRGRRARGPIMESLTALTGVPTQFSIPWWRLANPFSLRFDRSRVLRNVEYARVAGRRLRLDVHLPPQPGDRRPAIVQIHGGGWVMGDKREQGVPLLRHLSDRGFVGFNVNYRLSPGATFPDHLVDIKRAIAWIRAHAAEYGVDPRFIAVTGGSAGGHLASMVALTSDQPRFQPGFEDADTSVAAAVPLYAIYDLTDHSQRQAPGFHARLLEPLVIKAFYAEEPEKFVDASPTSHVNPDAPPFFVIHGETDTMAPLDDAREFVASLREVSRNPVLFAVVSGGQHSFDLFLSPRSIPVIEGVGLFLAHLYEKRAGDDAVAERSTEPAEL